MNTNKKSRLLLICLLLAVLVACRKEEYMPQPIGESIPFSDSITLELDEYLENSSYTLFRRAWQRSSLPHVLNNASPVAKFTILIPDNAALTAGGWDQAAIDDANLEVLDQLLRPYVLTGRITPQQLQSRKENYPAVSLYTYPDVRYANSTVYAGVINDFYRLHMMMGLSKGELLINGQAVGALDATATMKATVYPITRLIEVPTKTAWQYIREDSRFSIYVALLEYTDTWYKEIFRQANGYLPAQGHSLAQAFDRNSILRYRMTTEPFSDGTGLIPVLSTWFIPTNEAFHKAGFNSLDDLIDFNRSRKLPQPVWVIPGGTVASYYRIDGEFATDSLLDNHHNWGRRSGAINFATTSAKWSLFYSNDLRAELLGDYMLNYQLQPIYPAGTMGSPLRYEGIIHYAPFEIQRTATDVFLQVKESQKIVKIVQEDISTLNGVIHVVDDLLKPAGF